MWSGGKWNPAGSDSYQQKYPLTVECNSNSIKPVTLYRRQQTRIRFHSFDFYDRLLQSGKGLKLLPRNQDLTPPTTAAGKTLLTGRNLERDQALIREHIILIPKCMLWGGREGWKSSVFLNNVFWLCHWLALKILNSSHEPQPGGCDIKTLRVLFTYAAWCPAWAAPPWTFVLAALAGGLKAGETQKQEQSRYYRYSKLHPLHRRLYWRVLESRQTAFIRRMGEHDLKCYRRRRRTLKQIHHRFLFQEFYWRAARSRRSIESGSVNTWASERSRQQRDVHMHVELLHQQAPGRSAAQGRSEKHFWVLPSAVTLKCCADWSVAISQNKIWCNPICGCNVNARTRACRKITFGWLSDTGVLRCTRAWLLSHLVGREQILTKKRFKMIPKGF